MGDGGWEMEVLMRCVSLSYSDGGGGQLAAFSPLFPHFLLVRSRVLNCMKIA